MWTGEEIDLDVEQHVMTCPVCRAEADMVGAVTAYYGQKAVLNPTRQMLPNRREMQRARLSTSASTWQSKFSTFAAGLAATACVVVGACMSEAITTLSCTTCANQP